MIIFIVPWWAGRGRDNSLGDDGDEGQDSDGETELADALSNAVKLLLERSLISLDVHRKPCLTLVGAVASGEDDRSCLALLDFGALEHEWVRLRVRRAGGLLLKLVRLTSQSGLVCEALGGGDDEAVGRDSITVLDDDDVSDDEFLRVNGLELATALACYSLGVSLVHEFLKLLLLGIVVTNGHNDDDDDGEHDTRTLLEAFSHTVLDDAERGGDDGGDDEDFEDEVLKDLLDHVANGTSFSFMPRIFTVATNKIVLG